MDEKTEDILKKRLKKGSTLILAVSGGPDSVYLLQVCLEIIKRLPLKIVVAHVNHKLRGRQSDLDQKFVQNLAKKYGLPFEKKTLFSIPAGNLEEESRKLRYDFLENVRKKYSAEFILTAHHQDDNIETALFNLARGSFLKGISGMRIFSREKHLLRPLLNVTKKEILSYLKKRKIAYRLDRSNADTRFSRNLLRNKIIPLLNEINGNFSGSFLDFMDNMRQIWAFLENESALWLKREKKRNGIPAGKFLELPVLMQRSILAQLYVRTHGSIKKFNRSHLEQIMKIIQKNKSGVKKEFGKGYYIEIGKPEGSNKRFIRIKRFKEK